MLAMVSSVVRKRQFFSGTPGVFIRASLPKPHISCKAMITTLEALRHTVSIILRQAGLW